MTETLSQRYIRRFESLKSARGTFNSQWEDISKVIRPAAASFTSLLNTEGNKVGQELYDSTGTHANELLASGFYSLLTSPTTKWFDITTDNPKLNTDREVGTWLSEVSRIMYFEIQRPQTGFATALHELYLDYGAYGNGVLFVTERSDFSSLLFSALPVQECYFAESEDGRVDTLYRNYMRTVIQLVEKYGIDGVSKDVKRKYDEGNYDEKVEVLHIIEPSHVNYDAEVQSQMPFVSIYIEVQTKHLLLTSGYKELPFMAARFYKTSYEVYGRGPGSTALPDLKMLQQISKTVIRGAQKIVDPPLMVPDNGLLSPLRTIPGGVTYFRPGTADSDMARPLITGGKPELGEELAQGIRNRIREMFYVDQLQLNQGPQMTATEVIQRTEEKMRLMGPVVGRAQTELLGPALERVFSLLDRAGMFPDVPAALAETAPQLKIIYTSPIAKSQDQTEANSLLRVTQLLAPFMSMNPSIMDVFDDDAIARGVGQMYSLNPKFFRSEQDVTAMRQDRQQQQQMMQQAELAKTMGIGLNNTASGMDKLGGM